MTVTGFYEGIMSETKTTRYDVTEHLRTPQEIAAYLQACLEEVRGNAAFIAKALGDVARATKNNGPRAMKVL